MRAFGVGHEFRGLRDVAERTAFIDAGRYGPRAWRYETDEVPDFDELVAAAQTL